MQIEVKTLEYVKILSLVVIAISSAFIALWLSQILQSSGVFGRTLSGISETLFQLSEIIKEEQ